jgi:lipid-A-disaccharide synthase
MLSCGEASGDLYAGALVAALRTRDPEVDVFGFGGPRLEAAGAELIGAYDGVSVTGLVEAASVVRRAWRMSRRLREAAAERLPDVFVAIDFPDFNLRLLPRIRQLGIPIVYYVSPQLWAWRAGRIDTLRRNVDRMAVIFPFEQAIYERAGVPVDFVGHPLIDLAEAPRPREEWVPSIGLDPARPIVALLPGSRPNELDRILPPIADALPRIVQRVAGTQFLVARAPGLASHLFAALGAVRDRSIPVSVVDGAADQVIAAADVVVTASGTATVQTALHGRPMVVVYGLSPVTYAIARHLVRVPRYAMPNLVAGRPIVPELIQRELTPDRVADEVVSLLTDQARADRMRADLAEVRRALGGPGASLRAADVVLAAARRPVGAG